MSIIGRKIVSRSTGQEGTIIKANSSEIVVSFVNNANISVRNDKINELFETDTAFMNDLSDHINGYKISRAVPKIGFLEFYNKYHVADFNKQQIEAIKAIDGANLILAVPGSGKTTVLTYRLGYLAIARNIRPESILAITYTNAAADEMRDRLHRYFGDDINGDIEISTINSFSYNIVRRKKHLKTASEEDVSRIVSRILHKNNIPFYDDIIRIYTGAISLVKSKPRDMWDETIEDIIQQRNGLRDFVIIFNEYNNALRNENLIDFNDQNNLAYEYLKNDNDLRSFYRNKYRYLC